MAVDITGPNNQIHMLQVAFRDRGSATPALNTDELGLQNIGGTMYQVAPAGTLSPLGAGGIPLPTGTTTLGSAANTLDLTAMDGESMGGIKVYGRLLLNANATGHLRVPILLPSGLNPANQQSAGDGVTAAMACLAAGLDPIGSSATILDVSCEMPHTKTGVNRQWFSTAYNEVTGARITVSGVWLDTATPITFFRLWLIDASTLVQQGSGCFLAGTYLTWNAMGLG